MSDPFIGEIKIYAFNFAPKGWATCDGQILSIAQNQALFSLLGTTFGGNGQTTFGLPDFRGRTPVSPDPNGTYVQGQTGGSETVTLTTNTMPMHTHLLNAQAANANAAVPTGNMLAQGMQGTSTAINYYAPPGGARVTMDPRATLTAGGNQPHPNMQPYLTLNFCIALVGIYPSRP